MSSALITFMLSKIPQAARMARTYHTLWPDYNGVILKTYRERFFIKLEASIWLITILIIIAGLLSIMSKFFPTE